METETRGQRLKKLREGKELSQQEVADKVGTTKANVSKWEKKASADMALDVFFKLADLYEVDPRELATGQRSKRATIPDHRLRLIQAYGRLPDEIRLHIRGMIESLDTALSPRYMEWSKREADRAARRPAVHSRKAKYEVNKTK